jgi:hypothetical protein
MNTRKQYLDGDCTHQQYYAQFVNAHITRMVSDNFSPEILKAAYAKDEHFNSIPLHEWDMLASWITPNMKPYGDYLTLAGQVCIAKEAARQIATA